MLNDKSTINNEYYFGNFDVGIQSVLLHDFSSKKNIKWCTNDYIQYGNGYGFNDPITSESLINNGSNVIKPRILKNNDEQKRRTKEKAEVFTPSWVCNIQNNLIDEDWFHTKNPFNLTKNNEWESITQPIDFKLKSWKEYVFQKRMEVACGEAPYIVSRYDTVSGHYIQTKNRIGILDRKIRVINENTIHYDDWFEWVQIAYKSVYGFEWQGDNLLIARENLILTFIDYYIERFQKEPSKSELMSVATIISWNFWQMDGIKMVIPESCNYEKVANVNLFGEEIVEECIGCNYKNPFRHDGIYSKIMNWQEGKEERFVDSIKIKSIQGGFSYE